MSTPTKAAIRCAKLAGCGKIVTRDPSPYEMRLAEAIDRTTALPQLISACRLAKVRLESGNHEEQQFNKGIVKVITEALELAESD